MSCQLISNFFLNPVRDKSVLIKRFSHPSALVPGISKLKPPISSPNSHHRTSREFCPHISFWFKKCFCYFFGNQCECRLALKTHVDWTVNNDAEGFEE